MNRRVSVAYGPYGECGAAVWIRRGCWDRRYEPLDDSMERLARVCWAMVQARRANVRIFATGWRVVERPQLGDLEYLAELASRAVYVKGKGEPK